LGTEPAFEVTYPVDKVSLSFRCFLTRKGGRGKENDPLSTLPAQTSHQCQFLPQIKYVIDGRASIIEDGQNITATAGDAIFFPASSVFTILPTVFTAF
jgi:hypothetical protein